ncbi:MAG: hypothetical protein UIC65_02375 [Alphaproteobacteria bacterium]|nr:hypothetical protein [Alphaproteobacteria bacterium]
MMCSFDSCCDDGLFTNGETTRIEVCRNKKYTCTKTWDEENNEFKYVLEKVDLSQMCDGKTTCNKDNFGKYVYCSDNTDTPPYKWEYCKSNFDVEAVEDKNCDKGYFWYNNKCNSCEEITGEKATTIKPNAVMLSNCVVGTDTTKTYNDEKGEFKYVAQCYVGCTEETKWYCPSA